MLKQSLLHKIAISFIVALLFSGCSMIENENAKKYKVECKECELLIEYDVSKMNGSLDVKGL